MKIKFKLKTRAKRNVKKSFNSLSTRALAKGKDETLTSSPTQLLMKRGKRNEVSSPFFWILSLVLIIVLSVSFIFQINTIASKTRLIQVYDNRLEIAEQENELLIINSAKKNSLDNVKNLIEYFGFERVDSVHHIKVLDGVVVAK